MVHRQRTESRLRAEVPRSESSDMRHDRVAAWGRRRIGTIRSGHQSRRRISSRSGRAAESRPGKPSGRRPITAPGQAGSGERVRAEHREANR